MDPGALTQTPAPAAAGFDAERLNAIPTVLGGLVERGRLPGAVTLVLRRGRLAAFDAFGVQDPATGAPMRRDAIFRIYSMTKPLVSVAAMMLFEQGRLLLSDPVAKYLPEFAATQVHVDGEAGSALVAPQRPMTIQDLLRHTAGLTYEFLDASAVRRLYLAAGVVSRARSNAEHAQLLAGLPLMHQPGTFFDYSRATDILGRVVEVVSGETLGAHLQRAIFAPLGMVDTAFHVAADRHARIAEPFTNDPDGAGRPRSNPAAAAWSRRRSITPDSCSCCWAGAPSERPGCSARRRSSS
jgi:CubicO group peptidase (beta-lactamase class C family)